MTDDVWSPAPEVTWSPVTVVTQSGREGLARLLAGQQLFAALHFAQPDPSDPTSTMVSRQWLYWEPVSLVADGSVLWNPVEVVFPGVSDLADSLWLALSSDSVGVDVWFSGEIADFDRASGVDGGSSTVVLPIGTIRLSIA